MIITTRGLVFAPDELFELKIKYDMKGLYFYRSQGQDRYKLSLDRVYKIEPKLSMFNEYSTIQHQINALNETLTCLSEFKNINCNSVAEIDTHFENNTTLIKVLSRIIYKNGDWKVSDITQSDNSFKLLLNILQKIKIVDKNVDEKVQFDQIEKIYELLDPQKLDKPTIIQYASEYYVSLIHEKFLKIRPIYISLTHQSMDNDDIILNYDYNIYYMRQNIAIHETNDLTICEPFRITYSHSLCYAISALQCIVGNKTLLNLFNNAIKRNLNYTPDITIFTIMDRPNILNFFYLQNKMDNPVSLILPYFEFIPPQTTFKYTCEGCNIAHEANNIDYIDYLSKCEFCGAEITPTFDKLGDFLILRINECVYDPKIDNDKPRKDVISFIEQKYTLFACTVDTRDHYIAYRKYNNFWYKLNDDDITKDNRPEIKFTNVFPRLDLLFYEKFSV